MINITVYSAKNQFCDKCHKPADNAPVIKLYQSSLSDMNIIIMHKRCFDKLVNAAVDTYLSSLIPPTA